MDLLQKPPMDFRVGGGCGGAGGDVCVGGGWAGGAGLGWAPYGHGRPGGCCSSSHTMVLSPEKIQNVPSDRSQTSLERRGEEKTGEEERGRGERRREGRDKVTLCP